MLLKNIRRLQVAFNLVLMLVCITLFMYLSCLKFSCDYSWQKHSLLSYCCTLFRTASQSSSGSEVHFLFVCRPPCTFDASRHGTSVHTVALLTHIFVWCCFTYCYDTPSDKIKVENVPLWQLWVSNRFRNGDVDRKLPILLSLKKSLYLRW